MLRGVAGKLRALDKDGFRVVFFTNQAGIEKDKVKPDTVKDKIEAIIKELEEFFLDEKPAAFEWKSINPNEILKKATKPDPKQEFHKKGKELVVMVGCPASGKSTFRKRYLEPHGYVAVNRDTLGTAEKCIKTPFELAHHLNLVRQNQTNGEVRRIPDVGYNVFKKNFEEPTKAEGFTEIVKVNFMAKFDSTRDEEIFKQWTTAGH
nr:hypothetical protein BaRGS_008837 [Batillaria attramentaria]